MQVDDGPERMNKKIRDAQHQRVPYMAVIGQRETAAGQVSVRNRAGEQTEEALDAFADRVTLEIAERRLS